MAPPAAHAGPRGGASTPRAVASTKSTVTVVAVCTSETPSAEPPRTSAASWRNVSARPMSTAAATESTSASRRSTTGRGGGRRRAAARSRPPPAGPVRARGGRAGRHGAGEREPEPGARHRARADPRGRPPTSTGTAAQHALIGATIDIGPSASARYRHSSADGAGEAGGRDPTASWSAAGQRRGRQAGRAHEPASPASLLQSATLTPAARARCARRGSRRCPTPPRRTTRAGGRAHPCMRYIT